ncbi:MAG: MBL fold metallo-hydrolase, partial [Paraclostridium sp.]
MTETILLYKNGIKHWNRNEISEAKQYMDKALSDFIKLDTYDKKNLIKFYININEIEKATKILKYMLYNNDDLLETISCLLIISEEYLSEEDLFFIERISIIKTNIELNLILANVYLNKGLMLRAYERASNTVDYIENTKDIIDKDIYYKLILMLTEIEYSLNNFAQARFQIKKLIYTPVQNSIKYHEKIIYWSVVLGNLNELISTDTWNDYIKNIQSDDLKIIVDIWISIYNKEISYGKYKIFKNTYIHDDNLRERSNILNMYIKKCMKDESWKVDLKKTNPIRCYLIMIMYYEYMTAENFNKDDIRSFFDKYYEYHYDIPQIVNLYSSLANKICDKSLSDIDIQFIGGANKIGGSCILIRYKNTNLLLDAGANLNENKYYPDFTLLEKEGITLKDIDYLIISHAHLDHTGSVPYIYKENNNVKILTTHQTKNI